MVKLWCWRCATLDATAWLKNISKKEEKEKKNVMQQNTSMFDSIWAILRFCESKCGNYRSIVDTVGFTTVINRISVWCNGKLMKILLCFADSRDFIGNYRCISVGSVCPCMASLVGFQLPCDVQGIFSFQLRRFFHSFGIFGIRLSIIRLKVIGFIFALKFDNGTKLT